MADSWLIMAVKVKDHTAANLKRDLYPGTIGGSSGTPAERLATKLTGFVGTLLRSINGGVKRGNIFATVLDTAGTLPAGNIACTRANAAGNYVRFTYGGQAITLTEGVDFLRGASDTTCAANLAAAINAHATLKTLMTAAGVNGDCGLTAKIPTALLHDIALSTDDGTAFAFTQLTGGTEGAAQFFLSHFGTNVTP
jgi:hypothetical protein